MSEVSAERIGRLAMKIVENVREEGEIISDEEIISDKEGANASIDEQVSGIRVRKRIRSCMRHCDRGA